MNPNFIPPLPVLYCTIAMIFLIIETFYRPRFDWDKKNKALYLWYDGKEGRTPTIIWAKQIEDEDDTADPMY